MTSRTLHSSRALLRLCCTPSPLHSWTTARQPLLLQNHCKTLHDTGGCSQSHQAAKRHDAQSHPVIARVIRAQFATCCSSDMSLDHTNGPPYESCKIFKSRLRRNAFSKLVHRQYKSFPPDRFCQVEMKNPTRLSNKTNNA